MIDDHHPVVGLLVTHRFTLHASCHRPFGKPTRFSVGAKGEDGEWYRGWSWTSLDAAWDDLAQRAELVIAAFSQRSNDDVPNSL